MTTQIESSVESRRALRTVKAIHTLAWVFFASCIIALPWATSVHNFAVAAVLAAAVAAECVVIALNRGRCPLTAVAARYTTDRRPNFDIYLPVWIARWNKIFFGSLYVGGLIHLVVTWVLSRNLYP